MRATDGLIFHLGHFGAGHFSRRPQEIALDKGLDPLGEFGRHHIRQTQSFSQGEQFGSLHALCAIPRTSSIFPSSVHGAPGSRYNRLCWFFRGNHRRIVIHDENVCELQPGCFPDKWSTTHFVPIEVKRIGVPKNVAETQVFIQRVVKFFR